jgi:hypothetical protein
LHRPILMRAILLISIAVAGCGSDMDVADLGGADLAAPGSLDLAVCTPAIAAPPSVATPCGPLTCAPGQICVEHQPGFVIPDMAESSDGGSTDAGASGPDLYEHSCTTLPSKCQQCGGCGFGAGGAGAFGCFSTICRSYETGCRFDGATVTCVGV